VGNYEQAGISQEIAVGLRGCFGKGGRRPPLPRGLAMTALARDP
jgi:hypothetical protein